SLEFRSLIDRLQEAAGKVAPRVEPTDLDLGQSDVTELAKLIHTGPAAVRVRVEEGRIAGAAVSAGELRALYADVHGPGPRAEPPAHRGWPAGRHDAKPLERRLLAEGGPLATVAFDTMLAGYLLDPAAATYPLSGLSERYLGVDVLGGAEDVEAGQLFAE